MPKSAEVITEGFKAISLCASAKKIAEAKLKIIESLRQLFVEAKIVELRGLHMQLKYQ